MSFFLSKILQIEFLEQKIDMLTKNFYLDLFIHVKNVRHWQTMSHGTDWHMHATSHLRSNQSSNVLLPMTCSSAVHVALPRVFSTSTMYFPASSGTISVISR